MENAIVAEQPIAAAEEPIIKVLPVQHQQVTPLVAWTAVWGISMLGLLPSMLQLSWGNFT